MALGLFKPKALTVKNQPVIVSVPDIKEYLVKEYERVNLLREENERLLTELENAKEIQMKYEAALVTLDEYSKRNEMLYDKVSQKQNDLVEMQNKVSQARNELNSYKIKFNEAAITKEEIKAEIVLEFKSKLVENINAVKGNLSKIIISKIINETELHPVEKGGAE